MTPAKVSLRGLAAATAVLALSAASAEATSLRLCNGTKDAVEFALSFREKAGLLQTQGWWHAPPGQCSEPASRGNTGIYYVHIRKAKGSSIPYNAGDKYVMTCAALGNFSDRPHDHRSDGKLNCAAHGLISLKFMKFEMSRADLPDVLTLEPNGRVTAQNGTAPSASPPAPPQAKAPLPAPAAKKTPIADERPAPAAKSQTPEACKRFPNLC